MEVILHHLDFPLPHEDDFNKNKYCSFKSVYYSFCDDYGVNGNEIWINGNWFYVTKYDNFGDEGKVTRRSPPDIFTLWIITQYKGFTRKGIKKFLDLCGYMSISSYLPSSGKIKYNR